jgi:hypothetical protein
LIYVNGRRAANVVALDTDQGVSGSSDQFQEQWEQKHAAALFAPLFNFFAARE